MGPGERRRNSPDLEHRVNSIPRRIGRGTIAVTKYFLKTLWYITFPVAIGAGSIFAWELYKSSVEEQIMVHEERVEVTRDAYGRLKIRFHHIEEYMLQGQSLNLPEDGEQYTGENDQEIKHEPGEYDL